MVKRFDDPDRLVLGYGNDLYMLWNLIFKTQ